MQLSSDIFNEVVYYLDNHEESLRIKKLIFCICKKYWENDITILNSVTLNELVQELLQLKPSNDKLTFSVYKLVKTLNRSNVYAPLAKVIIDQLSRLYHSQVNYSSKAVETQLIPLQIETTTIYKSSELVIDQVVANLASHQEESRLKKLIFAACKNQWQNNINVIDSYGLKNLILELRQTYQNKVDLREVFNKIVKNINKKDVYLAIANLILNQIEMLYDTEVYYEEENQSKVETRIVETEIIDLEETKINLSDKETQVYPFIKQNIANQNFATTIVNPDNLQGCTAINLAVPPSVEQHHKEYDPFELRLEIQQYTNPLRAKILLFSILFQPVDQTGQDWSALRSYTLEDLLDQLIQSGKNINELEMNLYNIARIQADVDSNLQTANVIIQAIGNIL